MISAIIVYGSVAAVLIYSLLYFFNANWRNSVERPKQVFQRQLEAYDKQHQTGGSQETEL